MAAELVDADVVGLHELRLRRGLRQLDLVADLVDGGVRGGRLGVLLGGVTQAGDLLHVEDQRPELVLKGLLRWSELRLSRREPRLVAEVVITGWGLARRRRHTGEHHRREGGKGKQDTTHDVRPKVVVRVATRSTVATSFRLRRMSNPPLDHPPAGRLSMLRAYLACALIQRQGKKRTAAREKL